MHMKTVNAFLRLSEGISAGLNSSLAAHVLMPVHSAVIICPLGLHWINDLPVSHFRLDSLSTQNALLTETSFHRNV